MLQQQRETTRGGGGTRTVGADSCSTVGAESYASIPMPRALLAQSYYDDAKRLVSQALGADEGGRRMEALEFYNQALTVLTTGLNALKGESSNSAMVETRKKMEKMKTQVKSRMADLIQKEQNAREAPQPSAPPLSHIITPSLPPTSTKTRSASVGDQTSLAQSTASSRSLSLSHTLSGSVTQSTATAGRGNKVAAKADLIFHLDRGVSLMQVDSRNHVRKFDDVDAVSIFCYQEKIAGQPPAFLQCGEFVYPLIPGKSPVLMSTNKLYMFPELKGEDGCSVGLVIGSATDEELQLLHQTLSTLANLKTAGEEKEREGEEEEEEEEKEKKVATWGTTVAGGIDRGVTWVSDKISQGTEVAGIYISKGANKLRDQIEPNEQPTTIPPPVKTGVRVTRIASGYVVGVSDFLMTSLARLTVQVGKEVKNTIAESKMMKGREINPHAIEAWKVTKSSVKGASTVFSGLERGAAAIVKKLGKETSQTVEHKYGEDAGEVTDDSLRAAGNVGGLVYTYWSWKTWGIQFLGKVGEAIRRDDNKEKDKLEPTNGAGSKSST